MLPAGLFQLVKPLQITFSRMADDVVPFYESVQAQLTRSRSAWITIDIMVIEKTDACRQGDKGFSSNGILTGKTMDPIQMQDVTICQVWIAGMKGYRMCLQNQQP